MTQHVEQQDSQRGILIAVSRDGVIDVDGGLPFKCLSAINARGMELVRGSTVIMGRRCYEIAGAMPGARTLVVTTRSDLGKERIIAGNKAMPLLYRSIEEALDSAQHVNYLMDQQDRPVWFVGGVRLFAEALRYANLIDMTIVPEDHAGPGASYWPLEPDAADWYMSGGIPRHPDGPTLEVRRFRRFEKPKEEV